MSIEGQGHSLTLVKGHSDFKVKCLTFGLYTQVSDSGPLGPFVSAIFSCTQVPDFDLLKQYFSTIQIQNICRIIKFDNYKHLKCMS